jgi:enoyl-CoA hydratase/carnithine racemase
LNVETPIDLSQDGSVFTVTLNRPEKLNALDLAMWIALARTLKRLDARDDVRCIIVCGAGGNFAAGADVSAFERERSTIERARAYGDAEFDGVRSIAQCRHPTVAGIEGACVGGGLEIAAACDIRICGASSRFGAPINRLGLTMSRDEIAFFVRMIGRSAALEILLEGRVVDAASAQELGLVSRVVPDDLVHAETRDSASRISAGAPLVNRWHKKFISRLDDPTPLSPDEVAEGYAAFGTEDFLIGYRAFLSKERPEFKGH